ncbi:2-polyprenyl-6-methoxyphenol hydroxylase-like FAD-dependent oxidoreductase [Kribbella voronezhensis]|uniref:2-polyprenyl-6-methoxyphenol hydroxylase-like FAD-dependent oxidoreductase n=1 Tax=Kribbella voronezhensis TaxID=2512212 RepID=A0A4R7T711_9ACTN|nr:FAD-dependent monooxygenase [Kribbella voronezhensis]TDU87389.1 2-polyprenyl-6-methoxyphenol hydroxylase-like FAD-dependent oxidoreductase [Kribbella voronezhensis]
MNTVNDVEVVVVGAGLTGLAATAFLAQQGVRVLTVDQHPGTSVHPKARLVNVRSMELYRALGVESEVRAAGEPNRGFQVAGTLAGDWETWIEPPADESDAAGLSPTVAYSCDQQRLEPILLRYARERGATVRFDTTAVLTDPIEGRPTVTLHGRGGEETVVRARFVIAADGARSSIRTQLGIALRGEKVEGESVSAVFRAYLEPALRGRQVNAIMCRDAAAFLFARGTENDRSWQLGTYLRPGWEALAPDALSDKLIEVIRAATGLPGLRPVIEDTARWTTGAYVADRFRVGPVFLVGDAIHVMPPYGGFGGNTGVQDAHNLAWKIAAVCRGDAADALLDSYESERRPIVELTVAQALLRSQKTPGQAPPEAQIDAISIALGFQYGRDGGVPVEDPVSPSGEPGTRAPHVRLADGRSTIDLLDPVRFTLIGPNTSRVLRELTEHPTDLVAAAPVDTSVIDSSQRKRWEGIYETDRTEGLLVRPDGIIQARIGTSSDLHAVLRSCLQLRSE